MNSSSNIFKTVNHEAQRFLGESPKNIDEWREVLTNPDSFFYKAMIKRVISELNEKTLLELIGTTIAKVMLAETYKLATSQQTFANKNYNYHQLAENKKISLFT